jgi:hypothetical protein
MSVVLLHPANACLAHRVGPIAGGVGFLEREATFGFPVSRVEAVLCALGGYPDSVFLRGHCSQIVGDGGEL